MDVRMAKESMGTDRTEDVMDLLPWCGERPLSDECWDSWRSPSGEGRWTVQLGVGTFWDRPWAPSPALLEVALDGREEVFPLVPLSRFGLPTSAQPTGLEEVPEGTWNARLLVDGEPTRTFPLVVPQPEPRTEPLHRWRGITVEGRIQQDALPLPEPLRAFIEVYNAPAAGEPPGDWSRQRLFFVPVEEDGTFRIEGMPQGLMEIGIDPCGADGDCDLHAWRGPSIWHFQLLEEDEPVTLHVFWIPPDERERETEEDLPPPLPDDEEADAGGHPDPWDEDDGYHLDCFGGDPWHDEESVPDAEPMWHCETGRWEEENHAETGPVPPPGPTPPSDAPSPAPEGGCSHVPAGPSVPMPWWSLPLATWLLRRRRD
jgi:hypothetical protein